MKIHSFSIEKAMKNEAWVFLKIFMKFHENHVSHLALLFVTKMKVFSIFYRSFINVIKLANKFFEKKNF